MNEYERVYFENLSIFFSDNLDSESNKSSDPTLSEMNHDRSAISFNGNCIAALDNV